LAGRDIEDVVLKVATLAIEKVGVPIKAIVLGAAGGAGSRRKIGVEIDIDRVLGAALNRDARVEESIESAVWKAPFG